MEIDLQRVIQLMQAREPLLVDWAMTTAHNEVLGARIAELEAEPEAEEATEAKATSRPSDPKTRR